MYLKFIDKNNSKSIYNNSGSCAQMVNYEIHEAKELNENTSIFFSGNDTDISKNKVIFDIDHNVKGLKKDEAKFINLTINFSDSELKHLKNNSDEIKKITTSIVDQYAKNYMYKDKNFNQDSLVWYACLHNDRKYKGFDKKVQEKQVKQGDIKPGLNTHVHIIISTRDKEMKNTLNPHKARFSTFNKNKFFHTSIKQFSEQYNLESSYNQYCYNNLKANNIVIDKMVKSFNKKDNPIQLDAKEIKELGPQIGNNFNVVSGFKSFKIAYEKYLKEPTQDRLKEIAIKTGDNARPYMIDAYEFIKNKAQENNLRINFNTNLYKPAEKIKKFDFNTSFQQSNKKKPLEVEKTGNQLKSSINKVGSFLSKEALNDPLSDYNPKKYKRKNIMQEEKEKKENERKQSL